MSFNIIRLSPDDGSLEPKCFSIDFFIKFFYLDYLVFQFFTIFSDSFPLFTNIYIYIYIHTQSFSDRWIITTYFCNLCYDSLHFVET